MSRDPRGPRAHRPPQGREVRRQLPRPRRPAARRGRQRRSPRSACPARPASPTPRWPTRVVAPYNAVPELDDDTACVIVEPVAANMGLVAARATGFLEGPARRVRPRRRAADLRRGHHRLPRRPRRRAGAARRHARPLDASARSSAAACNVGAYGGRRDVMEQVAPLGPVYQAGTLSGNPLATAAGLAALDLLDAAAYAALAATGRAPRRRPRATRSPTPASPRSCPQVGALVGLFFGADAPVDYAERAAHRRGALRRLLPRHARPRRRPGARAPTRCCSPASPTPTTSSTRSVARGRRRRGRDRVG